MSALCIYGARSCHAYTEQAGLTGQVKQGDWTRLLAVSICQHAAYHLLRLLQACLTPLALLTIPTSCLLCAFTHRIHCCSSLQVLDTIREIGVPDAVRIRLSKLCASELAGVQNTAAYLYTLLSKRGKTAKQAAIAKQAAELQARLVAMQRLGSMGGPMGQMGNLGHHNQLGGMQGMDIAALNALGGGLGGPMGQYGQLGQAHMSQRMQQGGLDLSNLRLY